MFTEQMTQQLGITCAPLPPVNRAGNTNTNINGWIVGPLDMGLYRRAMGFLSVGAMLGAGAVNACNASFLAGNTTNTACTDLTNTSTWNWASISGGANASISTNNNFATLEIRADQLPANSRYLALLINNNSATFFSAFLLGGECAYSPGGKGSENQLNTVQGLTQAVT